MTGDPGAGDRPGADPAPSQGPALRLTVVPTTDGGTDLHVELDRPRCGPVTIRLTCARTGEEAVAQLACPGPVASAAAVPPGPSGPSDPPERPHDPAAGLPAPQGDPAGLARTPAPAPTAPPAPTAAQVRAWARRQGMSVADVGRIPTEIVEEYLAATTAPDAATDPRPGTPTPPTGATQDHRPK